MVSAEASTGHYQRVAWLVGTICRCHFIPPCVVGSLCCGSGSGIGALCFVGSTGSGFVLPSLELVARGLPEGGPGGVGGGECCLTCSRPESWLLGGREYSDGGWGLVVGEWVAPPRSLMASLIGGSLNGFSTICGCTS